MKNIKRIITQEEDKDQRLMQVSVNSDDRLCLRMQGGPGQTDNLFMFSESETDTIVKFVKKYFKDGK